MDEVEIGEECIIGALAFINAKTIIPRRSLVVGNPGKIIKEVGDDMIAWKTAGTQLYQHLPQDCHESLIACQPFLEIPEARPAHESLYATWEAIKGSKR
jgi:carbonic anhydrase/acetyltransferase-like protein (isoleucine patch superfamily)